MATPLNILIVEDSQDDTDLLVTELRRAGFAPKWKRVETEADFLAELKNSPDIILSDYSMPQFSGLRAVELLQASGLDIPFILVSGTVGEEAAVGAMKHGSTDYLLKDRLGRLGQAIERALEQKRLRGEHKRIEQQLALQATALETAANAIIIADRTGTILWVNPAFTTTTGYSPEEAIGKTPRLLKSGKHSLAFYKELWKTILSGKIWRGEFINRRKDGSIFYDEHTVSPVRSADGTVTHFIGMMHDVSERKRVEEELRWKTALFEALMNSSLDGILVVGSEGKKIFQNQRVVELWKIPRHIVEDPDDAKQVQFVMDQTKNPREFVERVNYLYSHPEDISRDEVELVDGTILDRYSAPVKDKAGKLYGRIWTFRDVTERRKLEEQFRQAQKMEAVGQLAGGVAHDFNNILAVIQGHSQLMQMHDKFDPALLESTVEIDRVSERAANLTRQLLAFSRRQTMQPRDLDLNEIVASTTKMLQRLLGEDIRTEFKFASHPLNFHADAGMLDQILLNLAVNSRDAMPKGGRLIIETLDVEFDEPMVLQFPQASVGPFVCLSVSDTGCGIPEEIVPRIFDPFFTTKEVGKGTGLGLATVYGIVHQHHGWITVYSEVGKGTTFRVYFPRISRDATKFVQPALAMMRGGKETILFAEDEPALRSLVRDVLTRLGYRVLETATGVEALAVWKQNKKEIKLLLTDLVMPDGMAGIELAKRLLKDKPKLRVIYTSGYSPEIAGKEIDLKEGVNFLTKPFNPQKLAQAVRESLDN